MLNVFLIVIAVLVMAVIAVKVYGSYRWTAKTQGLRSELEGLPPPVERFFRTVLTEGAPMIAGAHLQHTGTFNMSETAEQWRPFTSDQEVVVRRPGFDWDGRIAIFPGLPVHVHDAYVAGEGVLHAALLGAVTVANVRGHGDIAVGELMRFFAEATWYPTALLPSQGVRWTAIDERSAWATMADGSLSVTLRFSFHSEGPIDRVSAEARARMVSGALVPTPWQGRFWNYEDRRGVRVPMDGEVAWLLPQGAKPYWRGQTTDIRFTFAQ